MRALAFGLAAGLLAGCATLGYQSSTIRVPRESAWDTYAQARYLYGRASVYVEVGCASQTIPADTCAKAAELRSRIEAVDATVRAWLTQPDAGLDPAVVTQLLHLVLRYATTAGALAL